MKINQTNALWYCLCTKTTLPVGPDSCLLKHSSALMSTKSPRTCLLSELKGWSSVPCKAWFWPFYQDVSHLLRKLWFKSKLVLEGALWFLNTADPTCDTCLARFSKVSDWMPRRVRIFILLQCFVILYKVNLKFLWKILNSVLKPLKSLSCKRLKAAKGLKRYGLKPNPPVSSAPDVNPGACSWRARVCQHGGTSGDVVNSRTEAERPWKLRGVHARAWPASTWPASRTAGPHTGSDARWHSGSLWDTSE